MSGPLVVITCGPSAEPIDAVRRITNFSTGALGTAMAEVLAGQGWEVLCLRSEGASAPPPRNGVVRPWMTNSDLWEALRSLPEEPAVVLHAAALADFTVREVQQGGRVLGAMPAKLDSRGGELLLTLAPAPKLIGKLRELFPRSRLVGWKYEADTEEGAAERAALRARQQLVEARLDATVLNGPSLGSRLEWWTQQSGRRIFANREDFVSQLPGLLRFDGLGQ